jgi:type I restriction enzyme S subunit
MRFKWLLQELISKPQKNKKWKMVKLGSFLTESRIPDLENNPKKRLSVRLHLKGVEIREYRGTESDGATAYFIRKAGQFIYGKQNIFRGSIGIVPPDLDGYSSTQDIPAFDISDSVCKNWLLFLFSYPNFYKKLELYASGSGSKRLHPIELFKIKIGLPSIEEQKQIAETLSTAQHEINLLKQLVEKYKIQKRGLMQKMLTGTWRIKPEIINQYKEE